MTKNDIEDLPYAVQSASRQFLEILRSEQADITLHRFSEVAQELKRIDVFNCMKGWPEWPERTEYKLASINNKAQRDSLVKLLNIQGGVEDWRGFADKFKFTNSEIQEIEADVAAMPQKPAAKALLDLMEEVSGGFPLSDLQELLQEIGRKDVANIVGKFIAAKSGEN